MGKKSSKTTQTSEAIEKLNQAIAEAEAELDTKSQDIKVNSSEPSTSTATTAKDTAAKKQDSSISKKTNTTKKSQTKKAAKGKTTTTPSAQPAPINTATPKTRQIKIETPGDSITVSRNNHKNNQLKLPTVRKIHFKISHIIGAILVILLIGFIARVAIWEHDYFDRMEGSERDVVTMIEVDEGEEVDEERPTETQIAEYIVAPDKPRYFSIPSLGINNARIVEIGLKSNGEISTPYNIYDVGWYQNSSLPGTNNVTIMDGHGGAPGIGIFGSLPKISVGAEIYIEMGDGREFKYQVVDTATKALGDEANNYMTEAFTSPQTGTGSLTVITCTGDYWLASRTYSHRFFLRAILVE